MNYSSTTVVGRITTDRKFFAENGEKKAMAAFSVATNRGTGNDAKVTYFECEARGQLATRIESYLKKGKEVLVEGNVQAVAYLDKQGEAKASLRLYANSIQLGAGGDTEEESKDPI